MVHCNGCSSQATEHNVVGTEDPRLVNDKDVFWLCSSCQTNGMSEAQREDARNAIFALETNLDCLAKRANTEDSPEIVEAMRLSLERLKAIVTSK